MRGKHCPRKMANVDDARTWPSGINNLSEQKKILTKIQLKLRIHCTGENLMTIFREGDRDSVNRQTSFVGCHCVTWPPG